MNDDSKNRDEGPDEGSGLAESGDRETLSDSGDSGPTEAGEVYPEDTGALNEDPEYSEEVEESPPPNEDPEYSEEMEESPPPGDEPQEWMYEDEAADEYEPGGGAFYFLSTLVAVAAVTVLRVFIGGRVWLGDAEAYYYFWSKHLDLSYYDHAPGIAYLIHFGTGWLGEGMLGVRIASIILSAGMALFIYIFGAALFRSAKVGFVAALLFIVTPAFFIGGIAAAPDIAFGFFWLLASCFLYLAVRREDPRILLLSGFFAGLGLLCKYSMILFWPAALLYILFGRGRGFITTVWPWAAALIGLLLFLPVLIWNFDHNWASFNYHLFERHAGADLFFGRFEYFIGGQLLYLSPFIGLGLILALPRALFNIFHNRGESPALPFWLGLTPLAFFYFIGAWTSESEPHWPLAGYLLLYPVLAHWVLSISNREAGPVASALLVGPLAVWIRPRLRRAILAWLIVPALLMNFVVLVHTATDLGFTFIPEDGYEPGLDITNELYGWDELSAVIGEELEKAGSADPIVASYHYTLCGQLAFAMKERARVICLSRRTDAFDFLTDKGGPAGKDMLFLTDNRYDDPPESRIYCRGGLEKIRELDIRRGGIIVRRFHLWRCEDFAFQLKDGQEPPKAIIEPEPPPPKILAPPEVEAEPQKPAESKDDEAESVKKDEPVEPSLEKSEEETDAPGDIQDGSTTEAVPHIPEIMEL